MDAMDGNITRAGNDRPLGSGIAGTRGQRISPSILIKRHAIIPTINERAGCSHKFLRWGGSALELRRHFAGVEGAWKSYGGPLRHPGRAMSVDLGIRGSDNADKRRDSMLSLTENYENRREGYYTAARPRPLASIRVRCSRAPS